MGVIYFLLLSSLGLAVTVQAQNCSKPGAQPNMDLKDDYILKDTFQDGSRVYFACSVGYTPAGGSTAITCTAGTWSPVTLKCERKTCGSVGEFTNGQVDYPTGIDYGDKAVFTCDIGYNLVGNREMTCGDRGWMGRMGRVPSCEVVKCLSVPEVANATYYPNNQEYEYSHVVEYTCDKRFSLIGSKSLTCSENGQFTPEAPTCRKVECEEPQIVNGYWGGGARPPYSLSSYVSLKCNSGYVMKGQASQTCDINGNWSPGLPTCERAETTSKATTVSTTTVSTTTVSPPPAGGGTKSGPIVAAVVVVAIIIIIGGVIVYIMKRQRCRRRSSKNEATKHEAERVALS